MFSDVAEYKIKQHIKRLYVADEGEVAWGFQIEEKYCLVAIWNVSKHGSFCDCLLEIVLTLLVERVGFYTPQHNNAVIC